MRTLTIDVLKEEALPLLQNLEVLELIRLRESASDTVVDWTKYKGAMSKQSTERVDQQLDELRDAWE